MKKNFKKSKFVILPALATLVLTGVASVTGTVAWFTANRTAKVTGSKFITTKTDSAMNVTVVGDSDSGTSQSSENSVTLDTDAKLTHGSYNAKANSTGSAYVANLDDSNIVTGFRDLGTVGDHTTTIDGGTSTNKWKESTNVWYAVAWKMEFTYKATADNETNYLLFDVNGSTFTDGANGGQTMPGFRIAFMTREKVLVVGGDSVLTHVKGTGDKDTENYDTSKNYAVITDKTGKLEDDAATLTTSILNLGTLPTNGTDNLTIQCVAWFEGTDPWIANKKDTTTIETMSNVTASLEFYTRASHN